LIEEALTSGALQIVPVNPLELYPDEFLGMVRAAVEEDGCRIVVLDSLRGYYLVMEEFGSLVANIHNLATYLNQKGVTTLLINEVEHITGNLMATELGVSYLADTIVLMRYAEHAGQVIKVISCLKKRLGDFQPELRQMSVTAGGIKISEKLEHLRGVLTGIPSTSGEALTGL
jgi:circadian clock protein KaiC